MSSLLAPATPPESDPVETTPPPEQSAMPPTDVETVPPPAPVIPIQVAPLPSLLPPEIVTSPAPILAPVIPVISPPVTVTPALPPATVTPTLPPVTSPPLPQPEPEPEPQPQPQPHPQPQPQPQPLPPTITPSPVTDITPPKNINPPNILPPTDKPVTVTPAPPTSTSKSATPSSPSSPTVQPPVTVRQPKSGPTTKPGPAITGPTKPGPSERPPKTSNSNPAAAKLRPHSPLPASAVLPSAPPLALPVPQTPSGGAWFPSASVPPSVLPSIPGTPAGEVNSPATPSTTTTPFFGETNGASASSSSSSAPSGVADHQNIQAAVPSGGGSGGSNVYVVGLLVGGALLLLLGAVFVILAFCCRRKRNKLGDQGSGKMHASPFINGFEEKSSLPQYRKQGSFDVNSAHGNTKATGGTALAVTGLNPGMGAHLSSGTFAYEELAEATSGFSEQNILGQGGFGFVHKGVLRNGKEVAVKQLKMGGDQGEREFRAEVDTISQVHHKHLVSLVGYCISGPERLLVYEFVPNNTLDFHLHGKDQPVMDWSTRLKIAIGSAKGLAYLHEDCSPTIIHRDIKASNILLDFNCEAKVSDFGLAKIFSSTNPSVTHMTTRVVGTFGYLAPEYASSGKVTDKTDVYSYGVVLLELITGRTPISNFGTSTNGSLVNWARPLLAQAIADGSFDTLADPRLQHSYKGDEMAIMVSCAAACVRLSSWRRPRMSQVIRALEGNLSASELDDGIKPGHSSMHFPYESLDFDARHYIEEMKKMALAASSRYSDNTSEYGLNPSVSSTDTSQHIC